jgi:hypothetical protein
MQHPTAVLNPNTKQEEAMQLLTADLRARLPALYEQEKNDNQTVHVLCSTGHKQNYAPAAVM